MAKKKDNIGLRLVLLVTLVLAFAFFAFFTNNFKTDFHNFYLKYNDDVIVGNKSGFKFEPKTKYSFESKYGLLSQSEGFGIRIYPNANDIEPFDYKVGVDTKIFGYGDEDWSKAFKIEQGDDYFTIEAYGTVAETIARMYPGKAVEVPELKGGLDYFIIEITPMSGPSIKLGFSPHIFVQKIETRGSLIF